MDLYKTKRPYLDWKRDETDTDVVIRPKTNYNVDYSSNPDNFKLHCYFPFGTWIVDEVVFDKQPMVFFVEGNSRFLDVRVPFTIKIGEEDDEDEIEILNKIDENVLKTSLQYLIGKNMYETQVKVRYVRKVRKIIWDAAMTHKKSKLIQTYLQSMGVVSEIINVSREPHGPMHILDRCVRTIRDLIYAYQQQRPREKMLEFLPRIVKYYNLSPHMTLEKMTYIKGMTPWNVHVSDVLERQIIKYCQVWNYHHKIDGHYALKIGDKVLVKEIALNKKSYKKRGKYRDGIYTIVGIEKGDFKLQPKVPHLPLVPRSMLIKIEMFEIGDRVRVKELVSNKTKHRQRDKFLDGIYTIVGIENGEFKLQPEIPDLPLVPISRLRKIKTAE